MARRGVTLSPGYRPGSHWATCDRDGFQYRAEDLKETWDGLWVNDEDYETRHPQDFLRVKSERISVTQPIRPENTSNLIDEPFESAANGYSALVGFAVVGKAEVGKERNIDMLIPSGTFNNAI